MAEKMLSKMGSSKESLDILTPTSMWDKFRKLALLSTPPMSGDTDILRIVNGKMVEKSEAFKTFRSEN